MIIVGKSKIVDKATKEPRLCKYSDVPTELNPTTLKPTGWVSDLTYMPIPYDLMHLRLKDRKLNKSGWWTGVKWKGLRLKEDEIVIAWKRNHEHD